jgi:hypothetical protein
MAELKWIPIKIKGATIHNPNLTFDGVTFADAFKRGFDIVVEVEEPYDIEFWNAAVSDSFTLAFQEKINRFMWSELRGAGCSLQMIAPGKTLRIGFRIENLY